MEKALRTAVLAVADRQLRACLLIGIFLQQWALMEAALRTVLGKCLGLDNTQAFIVSANIGLRQRLHILRTAAQMHLPGTERDTFIQTLGEIDAFSQWRNMIAHDAFYSTDSGEKVEFFRVRAKGKFELPTEEWDIERFFGAYRTIERLTTNLENYEDHFQRTDALMKALTKAPTESQNLLDLLGISSAQERETP